MKSISAKKMEGKTGWRTVRRSSNAESWLSWRRGSEVWMQKFLEELRREPRFLGGKSQTVTRKVEK